MQVFLFGNLSTKQLSTALAGGGWTPPTLDQGDHLRFSLRLSEQSVGAENVEVFRNVHSIRASIGVVDARPTGGEIQFSVGGVDAAQLTYPFTAAQLLAALDAVESDVSAVTELDGSFIIESSSEIELAVVKNCLYPLTFARFRYWQCGETGGYHSEIRLEQAEVANSSSFERVVPPAPTITRKVEGFSTEAGDVPEVQLLRVSSRFRGTYVLKRGIGNISVPLSVENLADEIAEALAPLADEGGIFEVENTYAETAQITFNGTMAGIAQDLLEIEVIDAPEGDITFDLDLDTASLADALRSTKEVKLPLAITLIVGSENDEDEELPITFYVPDVKIRRKINASADEAAQHIDWLRPPGPVSYVPFQSSQILTGSKHYTFTLTGGTTAVTHNLGTTYHMIQLVRRSTGAVIPNDSYTATINNGNQVTFSGFTTAPTSLSPVDGVITSAGPVSSFIEDLEITIPQVVGLSALLDEIGERLTDLEDLAPIAGLLLPASTTYSEKWALPPYFSLFPVLGDPAALKVSAPLAEIKTADLPSFVPSLVGAIHTATIYALPITSGKVDKPVLADVGKIFRNDSGAAVTLPMAAKKVSEDDQFGYSWRVAPNEFAAHDGVTWVPMVQYGAGSEKSYYCRLFEQTLWEDTISAEQLTAGRNYSVEFAVQLRTFLANSPWHWHLVIETAAISSDTSPSTTGSNISAVTWTATPAMAQRLVVGPITREYVFGYRVIRATGGTLTAEKLQFGNWSASTAPASADFAIRARLIRADAVNARTPRGFLAVAGFEATAEGVSANVGLARVSK